MNLRGIKAAEAAKEKAMGTYHIKDGKHTGEILSVEYNEEKGRVYLRIQLEDGTVYKTSTDEADYAKAPPLQRH